MDAEPIQQIDLGSVSADRFGDVISSLLEDDQYSEFKFTVAYMRESGINRLNDSMNMFLDRGGEIAGAVGVDSGITSVEALKALNDLSPESTIFNTVTNLTYHPKFYLLEGSDIGSVVVGSANLTRDGLFRNVEFGSLIHFELSDAEDRSAYLQYRVFVDELLDTSNPNVQAIEDDLLTRLEDEGLIESERATPPPSGGGGPSRGGSTSAEMESLFPPVDVSSAPPSVPVSIRDGSSADEAQTFIMQLSASDCSHRSGTEGTAMILIPKQAAEFFPELTEGGDTKPPDTYFGARLNTPEGPVTHKYRFWYYESKEEYRFRANNETINLTTEGGGDIMVVTKLEDEAVPEYEVTFVKPDEPAYDKLLESCDREAGDKKWGFVK